ncbi:MAG: hypothetical protein DRR16_10115 [Candidatus Parabeggiatoa sp. nov. 3]|nr:MAG: hypothetical protein DRR00_24890 [Gammaproteobacteria bacterium]RKZ63953.1 MAG: hypothetical protein DRQ99_16210 [Gammaproteobacteria bacterium]RKZ86278.1 MAG: hypothetical protein DRR16_10115 [Gammaproteobacteria bacterium]
MEKLRERDIEWGRTAPLAKAKKVAKLMFEEQKINQEQLEIFLKRLEANEEKNDERTMDYLSGKLTIRVDDIMKTTVFSKSTLLTIMKERLKLREMDANWGETEALAEAMNAAKRMLHDGKINQEQLEEFLNYMKEEDEKKQQASANINEH